MKMTNDKVSKIKTITVLGSTGSIGQNTLSILRDNPQDFKIYGLSGHRNIALLYAQCILFVPQYAVVATQVLAEILAQKFVTAGCKTTVLFGSNALAQIASDKKVDIVMAAIVGIAGLKPTYAAIKAGITVLLANKEALVTAGEIFISAVEKYGATLLPVDSEHNAIFQCLSFADQHDRNQTIDKIILTASGGPFYQKTLRELTHVTPSEACAHPNWKMGKKISVDSSTMMNKALEIIEAYWLFSIPIDKIEVLIHPQSIVHSMVKYCDGSFITQMGTPDMRTPIGYSLYYPKRHHISVQSLDLTQTELTFAPLDYKRFRAVGLVTELLENKNYSANIVLNAANEMFVDAFLAEKIQYLQIIEYIEQTLDKLAFSQVTNIDDVIDIDSKTREFINTEFSLGIQSTVEH